MSTETRCLRNEAFATSCRHDRQSSSLSSHRKAGNTFLKGALVMMVLLLTGVWGNLAFAQIFVNQDFSSGTLPGGWAVESNDPDGNVGTCQDNSNIFAFDCTEYPASSGGGPPSGFSGNVATIDIDNVGGSNSNLHWIVTDTFDVSGATNLSLTFDWQNEDFAGDGDLVVEVWDGTAYQEVFREENDANGSEDLDVTPFTNTDFRVRFGHDTDGETTASIWGSAVDNVTLANITCPQPTSLSTSNITTNSVDLSWNTGDSAQIGYVVAVQGPNGDTVGSMNTNATVTGLSGNTTYQFFVKEVCSATDTSIAAGPVSFTTECNAFTAPYMKNFDGVTDPAIPNCWATAGNEANQVTTIDDAFGTDAPPSSPNEVQFDDDIDLASGDTALLVSPQFSDLTNHDKRIRFKAAFEDNDAQNHKLYVGVMANQTDTSTFTVLNTVTSNTDGAYKEYTVLLNNASLIGSKDHVAIAGGSVAGFDEITLDDFVYEEIPSCPAPGNLSTSNVTSSSVDVSWTTGDSSQIGYQVLVDGMGGDTLTVSGTSTTVPGLNGDTQYDVFVREICQAGDSSRVIGPASITTFCSPKTTTHTQNFDTVAPADPFAGIDCWLRFGNERDEIEIEDNALSTNAPPSSPNEVEFGDVDITNNDSAILATPKFSDLSDYDNRVRFQAAFEDASSNNNRLFVGVMNNQDATTFTVIDIVSSNVDDAYAEYVVNLNDTAAIGSKNRIAFAPVAPSSFDEMTIDDVTYEPIPSCPRPDNLSASNITSSSADLSWTTGDSAQNDYIIVVQGPTDDTLSSTTTSETVSGLQDNTTYDAFLKEACTNGDTSAAIGPVTFTTKCTPFAVPYGENFDTSTFIDPITIYECWETAGDAANEIELDSLDGDGNVDLSTYPLPTRPNHVVFNDADLGTGDTSLFVSPELTGIGSFDKRIRVQVAFEDVADSRLFVGVMADPNDTASLTILDTLTSQTGQVAGEWREFIVNLDNSTAIGSKDHVAFANGDGTWETTIDTFIYEEIPPCQDPTNLSVSNLSNTSADLSWTSNGPPGSQWRIEYDTAGFSQGTGNVVTTTSNPYPLTGLSPNTTYDFYVLEDCAGGSTSNFAGPFTFTTLCNPFSATYTEAWDSASMPFNPFGRRLCWFTSGNASNQIEVVSGTDNFDTDAPPTSPLKVTFNDADYGSSTGDTAILVSSRFSDLTTLNNRIRVQVAFEDTGAGDSRLFVGVMANVSDVSTFAPLDTLTAKSSQPDGEWAEFTINLNDGSTIGSKEHIAFANGDEFFETSIDEVIYEPIPDCPVPSNLSTSNVTAHSVDASWSTGDSAQSGYLVYAVGPGGDTVSTSSTSTTVSGLNPSTGYNIFVSEVCTNGDTSDLIGPDSITTQPSCLAPASLASSNITSNSAQVSWTPQDTGDEWQITYAPVGGNTLMNGTTVSSLDSFETLSGLTPDTTYEFFVREICIAGADTSGYTGPQTFKTNIAPLNNPSACGLDLTIPDDGCASGDSLVVPIQVSGAPGTSLGSDVVLSDANLIIDHTADEDLDIRLESPSGVQIDLSSDNGGFGDDYGDPGNCPGDSTNFSVDATTDITAGSAPFIGSFKPEEPFANFNDNSNPNGVWKLVVCDDDNFSSGTFEYLELKFDVPPACPQPTALSFSNVTSNSVDLSWTSNATGSEWLIEYGSPGFVPGNGVDTVSVSSTSPTLSGLMPFTSYDAFVYEVCGSDTTANPAGPVSFTTICTPFTATYQQNWDTTNVQSPFDNQACWIDLYAGNASDIEVVSGSGFDTDAPPTSPLKVTFNDADLNAGDTALLVSPQLTDLTAYDKRVRVQVAFEDTADSKLFVGVMANQYKQSTFRVLDSLTAKASQPDGAFREFTVNLTDASTIGSREHIAFANGDGTWETSIDEVIYEPIPSCPAPTNLSASGASPTSLDVSWTTNDSSQIGYQVLVDGPGGDTLSTSSTSITVSGLTGFTQYDVIVREVCATNDTSAKVGPVTATTLCPAFTTTYTQGFDSIGAFSPFTDTLCWATAGNQATEIDLEANAFATDPPPSGPNEIEFEDDIDLADGDTAMLVSPQFADLTDYDNRVRVKAAFEDADANNHKLYVGVMADQNNTSSFVAIDTLTSTTDGAYREYTVNLNDASLIGSKEYIAIAGGSVSGFDEITLDDFVYEPIPGCPAPSNLTTSNPSGTTIDVSWTPGDSAQTGYIVQVDGPGGDTVSANGTSTTVSGLSGNVTYDVFLKEVCANGDTSLSIGPEAITTLCTSFSATYTQDFDTVTTPAIPACWSKLVSASSSFASVETNDAAPNSSPNHLELYNSSATGNADTIIAVSPEFTDLPSQTTRVRFQANDEGANDELLVGVMSDPNDANTFELVSTESNMTSSYQEFQVDFDNYTGSGTYIAFMHGRQGSFTDINIDDVVYEPIPSCPDPTNLSVSNVSINSVDVSWMTGDTSDIGYVVYVSGPNGDTSSVSSTSTTVSGLTSNTSYDVFLQEVCTAGDSSDLVGPVSFTTLCDTFTAPYSATFDTAAKGWIAGSGFSNSGSEIGDCWTRQPATSSDYFWGTRSGGTGSSNTGPNSDHTGAGGNYVFTEGSNGSQGDVATITSPTIDLSTVTSPVLTFWYHMHGSDMGTLEVEVSDDGGATWTTVFSISGEQQTSASSPWIKQEVFLTNYVGSTVDIRFSGTRGSNFETDMAVDDVTITDSPYFLWTGATSTDWNTASNWSSNIVPTASDSVIIDGNAPNQPVISTSPNPVSDIRFINNADVTTTFAAGFNTLTVHGNIEGESRFEGDGQLTFSAGNHAINDPATVTSVISVPSGATLTTNGNLTIEDGGSLMHEDGTPNGGGTVNGAITYNRQGTNSNNEYNYWGTPTKNTNAGILGSSLFKYNINAATDTTVPGLRDGWQSVNGSSNMQNGIGYISTGGGTVSFNGDPNGDQASQGEITTNVTRTNEPNEPEMGWNLVANPYPSGLDADAFLNANSGDIQGTVYFWDDDGSTGSNWSTADYATWNLAGGANASAQGNAPDGNIGAGQGFFVEASNVGTNTISFDNTMRVAENDVFFRQQQNIKRTWITVDNGQGLANEILVAFTDQATDGKDWGYDSKKFEGNPDIALYSKLNGRDYAIQTRSELDMKDTVALGVKVVHQGSYTLTLDRFDNLAPSAVVMLEDRKTNTFQNLRQNSTYDFTSNVGDIEGRFYLHYYPAVETATVDETCAEGDGAIKLTHSASNTWDYEVTNSQGDTVAMGSGWNGSTTIDDLDGGAYNLRLEHGDGYVVTKNLQLTDKKQVNASFTADQSTVYVDEEVNFTGTVIGANNFMWSFGDGASLSGDAEPSHKFKTAGTYKVELAASNEHCNDNHTEVIQVEKRSTNIDDAEEAGLSIRSAGDNRIFITKRGGEREKATISVHNTLGQEILNLDKTLSPGSKVTLRVNEQPSGSYFIKVTGEEGVRTENVILMRDEK